MTVAALLGGAATAASGADGNVALTRLSVACIRSRASHASEQVSQSLMGTPVVIIQREADWSRVRTPDGYEGWIINHSLVFLTDDEYSQWLDSPKVMVTEPFEQHDADRRTDLVAGCILQNCGDSLRLPDGRLILRPAGVAQLDSLGKEFQPEQLPRFAELYMGAPYLWGGLSSKGMDCSGLVRMAYMAQGRLLPRDAGQQALEGVEVQRDSIRAGDLIFFGNKQSGRVTHVAIYDCDDEYVHSSQLVRRNSLNPLSPQYLRLTVLHIRRMTGTPVSDLFPPKKQKKS